MALLLVGLTGATFIPLWGGILAPEAAMLLFVVVAHSRTRRPVERLTPLVVALAVPLAFAYLYPPPGFSILVMGLVFLKLVIFVCFAFVLAERCRNAGNRLYVARRVIVPASAIVCAALLLNVYTDWTFFVRWRAFFFAGGDPRYQVLRASGYNPIFLREISWHTGFAQRMVDLPLWALLGVATAYWLRRRGRMGRWTFALMSMISIAAGFSVPKRAGVVIFFVAALGFLLLARTRADRRVKGVLIVLGLAIALGTTYGANLYQQERFGWDPEAARRLVGLTKFGEAGFIQDDRFANLGPELAWLASNPRFLLVGSGWHFGAGYWSKPHDTYVALLVGGGLIGFVVVLAAVVSLFRRPPSERRRGPPEITGLMTLLAVAAAAGLDGYLSSSLEFQTTVLVLSIAWSAVLYRATPGLEAPPSGPRA